MFEYIIQIWSNCYHDYHCTCSCIAIVIVRYETNSHNHSFGIIHFEESKIRMPYGR